MATENRATLASGVVVNVFVVDTDAVPDWAITCPVIPEGFGIGALYDGTTFTNPPEEGTV